MSDHLPTPRWECGGCGTDWPCPAARAALAAEYADDPVALGVYMAVQLGSAAGALCRVPIDELHERFIGWPLALRTPVDLL